MRQKSVDLIPPPPPTTNPSALPAGPSARLLRWALSGGVPPLKSYAPTWPRTARLHAHAFTHGQSNPTYLITVLSSRSEPHFRFVIRARPHGNLLPGAHRVDREHRVLRALESTAVPVPTVFQLCSDPDVLGVEFYAMAYVPGTIFHSLALPDLTPSDRAAVYSEAIRVLCALRAVDPVQVGLADLVRPQTSASARGGVQKVSLNNNFDTVRRVMAVWNAQYDRTVAGGTARDAAIESAYSRIKTALDRSSNFNDDTSDSHRIVHGDFRLDNLVFVRGPNGTPVVQAVLDWELCTLADPTADLATLLVSFNIPDKLIPATIPRELAPMIFPSPRPAGVPSQEDIVSKYANTCSLSTKALGERLPLFLAAAAYKLAAIIHGVRARAMQGNAASPLGIRLGAYSGLFAHVAEHVITAVEPGKRGEADGKLRTHADSSNTLESELRSFMNEKVLPLEGNYFEHIRSSNRWTAWEPLEELKQEAKKTGLWNAFLPPALGGALSCAEYAPLAEQMGRCIYAAEVFNCSAPDTGNMELLARFGTPAQKKRWLEPLLAGEIRSCFAMTEPDVASSDATNIRTNIKRIGEQYVVNGRKWWTSGALDPRCRVMLLLGHGPDADDQPPHKQHTILLIPMTSPMGKVSVSGESCVTYGGSPGLVIKRAMSVFGYDDAPHGHAEIELRDVTVPVSDAILLGEREGFRAAQARLGGGRLHHCMRAIGSAERAHEMMVDRAARRRAFGKMLIENDAVRQNIGTSRAQVDTMRAVVHDAARTVDTGDTSAVRRSVAVAKVIVPQLGAEVIDRAVQMHGAAGVSQDTVLAMMAAHMRGLRLADGPDEAHLLNLAKGEVRAAKRRARL